MDEPDKRYFIKVQDEVVEVSQEVYIAYYKMARQERYLDERDTAHGLLHYEAWTSEKMNGAEYIRDIDTNVEEEALQNLGESIWREVDRIGDKYGICRLVAIGKTEEEIAEIAGISQQAVNKAKQKLFKKLKNIFEKNL